jgi:hypothetical protein
VPPGRSSVDYQVTLTAMSRLTIELGEIHIFLVCH